MFISVAYASEAAAKGAEGGLATSLGAVYPNPATLWPTWLAFIILFFLLWKFALPPIVGMLEKRAATIRESIAKAEETRIEAERLLDEYKLQLAEARQEAGKIIEQGRKVADSMKDEIVAKANEEREKMLVKAKAEIEAEKKAAMAELQASVADLSVAVAGKLLGSQMSAADHAKLIDKYVAEVGGLNEN
ncbi:MAG: F0F1 ATP synthase subunit B [Coriobacteriia bacterium]|nr:F0F1 ATP synthase subunit B [Coriobacteriia bacterium]